MLSLGCGPTYRVSVSALASEQQNVGSRSYVVLPGNKDVKETDLQFQEFAVYIDRAMSRQGFQKADRASMPDYVVFVAYSVSGPLKSLASNIVPHWGQTGVASSSTVGSIYNHGGGYSTFSGTTSYEPTYGITGYSTNVYEVTTYMRVVEIVAFDANHLERNRELREVWKVSISSEGTSGDLRLLMPYMIAAAQPYLGKSTGKQAIMVNFGRDDNRVAAIRDGDTRTKEQKRAQPAAAVP